MDQIGLSTLKIMPNSNVRQTVHHKVTRGNAWCFADVAVKKYTRRLQLVRIVRGGQHTTVAPSHQANDGPLWVLINSLVLGIICVLAFFDDSQWDKDKIFGIGSFSLACLVLGAISLSKQKTGKGMAITGVVLSSLALLAFIGMFSK